MESGDPIGISDARASPPGPESGSRASGSAGPTIIHAWTRAAYSDSGESSRGHRLLLVLPGLGNGTASDFTAVTEL
jgi:hypothetical protein